MATEFEDNLNKIEAELFANVTGLEMNRENILNVRERCLNKLDKFVEIEGGVPAARKNSNFFDQPKETFTTKLK
jgi:hypothetical protein